MDLAEMRETRPVMATRDVGLTVKAVSEKMRAEEKLQLLRKGATAAKVSTYVTVMLTGIKATVGLLSGSIALLADAVHSLSDIFTSLAVWLGMKLSQRRPSERFSYGFYRVETLAFLVVSIVEAGSHPICCCARSGHSLGGGRFGSGLVSAISIQITDRRGDAFAGVTRRS
jgi:hypothetical protein